MNDGGRENGQGKLSNCILDLTPVKRKEGQHWSGSDHDPAPSLSQSSWELWNKG